MSSGAVGALARGGKTRLKRFATPNRVPVSWLELNGACGVVAQLVAKTLRMEPSTDPGRWWLAMTPAAL